MNELYPNHPAPATNDASSARSWFRVSPRMFIYLGVVALMVLVFTVICPPRRVLEMSFYPGERSSEIRLTLPQKCQMLELQTVFQDVAALRGSIAQENEVLCQLSGERMDGAGATLDTLRGSLSIGSGDVARWEPADFPARIAALQPGETLALRVDAVAPGLPEENVTCVFRIRGPQDVVRNWTQFLKLIPRERE